MSIDIFWFPAIWYVAAAGGFLRYLDRGQKVFFFRIARNENLFFKPKNYLEIWNLRPVDT